MIVLRGVACLAVIAGLLAIYRTANQRSALLGAIFAFGVGCRALFGVALFAISLFEIPIFQNLQAGGGFWTLAIDAQFYYGKAATAAVMGLSTISGTDSSPVYLRAFAAWMKLTGISPANAILFNLLCFAGVAIVVLGLCRSRAVAAVVLGSISVDPALLIFSTQALKDSFSLLVIAVYAAGARLWWDSFKTSSDRGAVQRVAAGFLLLALAVYVMAGIRAYVALLMTVSMLVSTVGVLWAPPSRPLWKFAAAYIVLIGVLWGAFEQGASAYYGDYRAMVHRAVVGQMSYLSDLDHARMAFKASGGATSYVGPITVERAVLSTADEKEVLKRPERLGSLARGLAVLFLPISVLRALSIVTFQGGRGLLLVTDLDTIVIDLSLAACLYLAFVRRRLSLMPTELSITVFAILTTLLLAYVVTNYGTVFRLRLLAIAPLWLLPAVLDGGDDWPRA